MGKTLGEEPIIALGDQVQKACADSGVDVIGFVILTGVGLVEYRSPLPHDAFKAALTAVTEAF